LLFMLLVLALFLHAYYGNKKIVKIVFIHH
jgi:hypothetical protein